MITRRVTEKTYCAFASRIRVTWFVWLVTGKYFNQDRSYNSAIVSWEEFDHKFQVLFDRSRRRELIDFTLQAMPDSDEIDCHLKARHI
jgi:hypothetical protein